MSYQPGPPAEADIRATLAISPQEAQAGTTRTLNLPDGRQVTVNVPPGAYNGQVIQMPGQGLPGSSGQSGSLILTLAVQQQSGPAPAADNNEQTVFTNYSPQSSMPATGPHTSGSSPNLQQAMHTPTPPSYYGSDPYSASNPYTASNPYYNTAPPPVSSPGIPYLPPTQSPSQAPKRLSGGRIALLVLLVIVIIGAATGLFFVIHNNQVASDNASATATAQAQQNINATATATNGPKATATAIAATTATVVAGNPNPYPPGGGRLTLYSPLSSQKEGSGWDTGTYCNFQGGAYHVTSSKTNTFEYCSYNISYSDFAFEVQAKMIQGDDYGIIFRGNLDTTQLYLLQIGHDGFYALYLYKDNNVSHVKKLASGNSAALSAGYNTVNVIGVVAQGSTINWYANHKLVATVHDSTYSQGMLALIAVDEERSTDIAYTNAKVWTF